MVTARRISKKVYTWNGSSYTLQTTTRFLYDGWNLLTELDGSNALLRSYMWGLDLSGSLQGAGGVGGLLAMKPSGGAAQFAAYDGNGNVTALVEGSTSTLSANYEYSPFGETIRINGPQASANKCRFSTKYTDDESDCLYYGYRLLNPSTGRWLSRDPLGEQAFVGLYSKGKSFTLQAQLWNQSLRHSYAFVDNRPSNGSDALGLFILPSEISRPEQDWCRRNPGCCCAARNSRDDVLAEMTRRYPNWSDNTVENAIQHCAWMCYVVSKLLCSVSETLELGYAHEDGTPNSPAHNRAMDYHNNRVGVYSGGRSLADCFNKCEQAAGKYDLYWFEPVSGKPRRGLPADFPSYPIDENGFPSGPRPSPPNSPTPPPFPAPKA